MSGDSGPVFETVAAADDIARRLRVKGTEVTSEFVADVIDRYFELTNQDESLEDPAERTAVVWRIASEVRVVAWIAEQILEQVDQELDRVGGFGSPDASDVAAGLVASGVPVSASEVAAVTSAYANLTGHGGLYEDKSERSAVVQRAANLTGCRDDIVAAIFDEVDRQRRRS